MLPEPEVCGDGESGPYDLGSLRGRDPHHPEHALSVGGRPFGGPDLRLAVAVNRLQRLMVVLPQHHDHEVGVEPFDDPAHRVWPVEVVGPREPGGDPALRRNPDEPGQEDALGEVPETGSERVPDDRDAELPIGCRRPDGIGLGRRAVAAAVPPVVVGIVISRRRERDVFWGWDERAPRSPLIPSHDALDGARQLVQPDPISSRRRSV